MKESTKEFIVSALFMIGTVFAALVLGILVGLGIFKVYESFRPAQVAQEEETTVGVYRAVPEETTPYHALEEYTEGEGEPPLWWDPDEPMAVEWVASYRQVTESNYDKGFEDYDKFSTSSQQVNTRQSDSNPIQRTDIGCPDWNYDSTLWGWDGHSMEVWEMELFAKIVYLEFWGTSQECCEAGVDSFLQLWDSGYYGNTMGGLLGATAEDGSLVYSPYAYVWDWDYDSDGLAEMRSLCEERFYNGPQYIAPFFRLWYYHPWATPAYEIDHVFFSVPRW